jgi:hypothetical protein
MKRRYWRFIWGVLLGAALNFGLVVATASAQGADLTDVWYCDDGGTYYVRQLGKEIWWYGEQSPGRAPLFSNVARGTLEADNMLHLQWVDVPRGRTGGSGTLTIRVESNNKMAAVHKSGGFSGSVWTR